MAKRSDRHVGAAIVVGRRLRLARNKDVKKKKRVPWVFETISGIITKPELIVAKREDKVAWGVLNVSDKDVDVQVVGFSKVNPDGTVTYLGITPTSISVEIGKVGVIKDSIPQKAEAGTYTYGILVDGQPAWDPELQIES